MTPTPIPCPFGPLMLGPVERRGDSFVQSVDVGLVPILVPVRTIPVNLPPEVAALCTPAIDAYFAEQERADTARLARELDAHILEGKPLGPAWTGEGRSALGFPDGDPDCEHEWFEFHDGPDRVCEKCSRNELKPTSAEARLIVADARIADLERENESLRRDLASVAKARDAYRLALRERKR